MLSFSLPRETPGRVFPTHILEPSIGLIDYPMPLVAIRGLSWSQKFHTANHQYTFPTVVVPNDSTTARMDIHLRKFYLVTVHPDHDRLPWMLFFTFSKIKFHCIFPSVPISSADRFSSFFPAVIFTFPISPNFKCFILLTWFVIPCPYLPQIYNYSRCNALLFT